MINYENIDDVKREVYEDFVADEYTKGNISIRQGANWEAPEIYFKMSLFMHADKVNEPILLIHGEADKNSGTFPIQSERFYNVLKRHGATARGWSCCRMKVTVIAPGSR